MTPRIFTRSQFAASNDSLQFLEQAHVLDRDDGLIGKGFEKRDLLLSERTDLKSTN